MRRLKFFPISSVFDDEVGFHSKVITDVRDVDVGLVSNSVCNSGTDYVANEDKECGEDGHLVELVICSSDPGPGSLPAKKKTSERHFIRGG